MKSYFIIEKQEIQPDKYRSVVLDLLTYIALCIGREDAVKHILKNSNIKYTETTNKEGKK